MGNEDWVDFQRLSELAREAQAGEAAAYEAFLGLLYRYARNVIRARIGAGVDAEDVSQECLLGVHKSLATYHPSRPIKPWMDAIIRYKLADYFRACGRRREVMLKEEEAAAVTDGSAGANTEAEGEFSSPVDIRSLVNRLPAPLCRAVQLTRLDGLSCTEAAANEGISEPALRKRVSRAYRKLACMVESERGMEEDRG
jgi:RNA polymerase sigma-70 factor, ECF subfamily